MCALLLGLGTAIDVALRSLAPLCAVAAWAQGLTVAGDGPATLYIRYNVIGMKFFRQALSTQGANPSGNPGENAPLALTEATSHRLTQ